MFKYLTDFIYLYKITNKLIYIVKFSKIKIFKINFDENLIDANKLFKL